MYAFSYERPTSVADAVQALKNNEDAQLLAGGQTFIPTSSSVWPSPTR